ncbi:hypothetical protein ACX6XY_13240 [Streptomyces sp. O3]
MPPFPPSPTHQLPAGKPPPGRHWYATAAAIAVVLIGLGVAIAVHRIDIAADAVDTEDYFANGDTVTLRLEPESEKAIWVMWPGESSGPECDVTGPGDVALTDRGHDAFLTRDETWDLLYRVDVSRAGDYEITCSSQALSRYAIGAREGHLALVTWLALAAVLAVLGIVVCAVICRVTAVRRRGHRPPPPPERLPASGYPTYPPYPVRQEHLRPPL